MTGKADFGGFAEGDWTAKRASATADAAPCLDDARATTTAPTLRASSTTGAERQVGCVARDAGRTNFPPAATLTDSARQDQRQFASQMGEVAVTGTLEGKALKMTMVAQTPQGDMTVVLTGDADAATRSINGQAERPGVGAMPHTAKRAKQ